MSGQLQQELGKLKQGDHICLIYENSAEQLAASVPIIVEGLARGERCIYIADGGASEEVVAALGAAGVDIDKESLRGAFRILNRLDTHIRIGQFVPKEMIDFIRQAEAEALADGFSGLRLMGEMTWVLGPKPGCEQLIEFEALLDQSLTNSKTMVLCHYMRSRFDAPCIHDVFRTHPVAILGDQVCANPYQESSAIVLSKDQPVTTPEFKAKRLEWWLAKLKRARTAEQERERALEKLGQSERRLAEAQQVVHIGSWEVELRPGEPDLRTDRITGSDELYRLFGLQAPEGNISKFLDRIMPPDADRVLALAHEAIREHRPFSFDHRIARADGSVHVLHERGNVILNEKGAPKCLVGTVQDVTELRRAEQAQQEQTARLQALSRRLLNVQEEERRHLSRELHDEFGQILAAITVQLHAARGLAGDASRPRLDECAALLQQAGEQVRSLALELRPTMLDTLGLEATLRRLAEQHQQRTGGAVQVVGHLSGAPLPADLAIAGFRVVQEALTNVARHAAARHVWIELSQSESALELVVRDDGVGFDVVRAREQAEKRGSLGMLGMRERVEILGGNLQVESQPGRGARIRAAFPLSELPDRPTDPKE